MQFVVMMDLVGTLTLPVAIVLTLVLIISIARTNISSFTTAVPLVLLIIVLFSPAFLILITTKKWVYLGWMIVYLFALPIWNFVLPVYSFWHFDDFSWGETRKVTGEVKGEDHGKKDGVFDPSKVPLRRWEDYERRRIRSVKRREKKLKELGPVHMTHGMIDNDEQRQLLQQSDEELASNYTGSDMSSIHNNPMHYFDPSKEAPVKSGNGYYPMFRPQQQGPPTPLPKQPALQQTAPQPIPTRHPSQPRPQISSGIPQQQQQHMLRSPQHPQHVTSPRPTPPTHLPGYRPPPTQHQGHYRPQPTQQQGHYRPPHHSQHQGAHPVRSPPPPNPNQYRGYQ